VNPAQRSHFLPNLQLLKPLSQCHASSRSVGGVALSLGFLGRFLPAGFQLVECMDWLENSTSFVDMDNKGNYPLPEAKFLVALEVPTLLNPLDP
jgi:hypothetical protein